MISVQYVINKMRASVGQEFDDEAHLSGSDIEEIASILHKQEERIAEMTDAFDMATQESSEVIIALQEENGRLRKVVSECAAGLPNGAFVVPEATIEFMELLPGEIHAVSAASQARVKVLEEALEPMKEVLRISDRKHPAWDAARAAIAKIDSFGSALQQTKEEGK